MAHLYRVMVPVGDIERAQAFYAKVLGQEGRRVSPGRHYFDCEGTILACFDPRADGDGRDARSNPEPIYLAVDDIQAAHDACKQAEGRFSDQVIPGVGALAEIEKRPWGELCFYVEVPFGNSLCFVSRESVFTG